MIEGSHTILTEKAEWKELAEHYSAVKDDSLRDLFAADASRAENLSVSRN